VGLTRARDVLIFATQDSDGGYIALPRSDVLELPDGTEIPSAFRALDRAGSVLSPRPFVPVWFVERTPIESPLDAIVTPSSAAPIATASVIEAVDLGDRIVVGDDVNAVGNALHAAIAAELVNPARRDGRERAAALLAAHGATGLVSADDVVAVSRRFAGFVRRRFAPERVWVEHPVQQRLPNGQVVAGYADVLLETAQGWIVIDHKSSPRPRSEWSADAALYSGQLAAYAGALRAAGRTVHSTWIHFPVTGGLIRVDCDPPPV
jgi:ATP-dependent helicase/nuclease subunit A